MSLDLQTITQLRNRTGAGIADCKAALEEAGGDLEQAITILRQKGGVKAAKKAARETNEGLVAIAREGNRAATVVLLCETDFVAKNEDFIAAVSAYANKLLTMSPAEFKPWAEENIKGELVLKIGENIQLGDFGVISGEVLGSYLHSNKKTAAVVALSGGKEELANDLAMQVVALSPDYLRPEEVPAEVIAKETAIYRQQLAEENKPAEIVEKIIAGKLNKFYEETCLLNQAYVKDDSKKVSDLLPEAGENVTITAFKKYSV